MKEWYYLETNGVHQKSFYKKAVVFVYENGDKYLRSYDTIVCCIEGGEFKRKWTGYSATTMNHVNAFRYQEGLEKLYKSDWLKLKVF